MDERLGKNIRKLRLEKKMTQEQMAEKCNVMAQTVSRWETGVTFPDVMLLPVIARLFGVLVDDLFQESPEGYTNQAERLLALYEHSHKHEDFMSAVAEYEKMIKYGEATANDYRGYGILHQFMAGNCCKKAYEYFDKAIQLYKDTDEEAYYAVKSQKNMLRIDNGQAQACIEEQKQVVKASPNNQKEWQVLLSAYFWAKRYEEAFTYWQKAIDMGLDYLDTKYSMAFCYEEIGEYQKAYKQWDEIIESLRKQGLDENLKWPEEMRENCRRKMNA